MYACRRRSSASACYKGGRGGEHVHATGQGGKQHCIKAEAAFAPARTYVTEMRAPFTGICVCDGAGGTCAVGVLQEESALLHADSCPFPRGVTADMHSAAVSMLFMDA